MPTCLGFHVECGTMLKGAGVTIMGLILFVGSIYLVLAAVFGRWMGYLVASVAFYGWIILLSSMWSSASTSQGPDDQDEPRAARPGARLGTAGGRPRRRTGRVRHLHDLPGRALGGADAGARRRRCCRSRAS